jgi:hypothetical protein
VRFGNQPENFASALSVAGKRPTNRRITVTKTKTLSVTKTNDTATDAERLTALRARRQASIDRTKKKNSELRRLIVESEDAERLHGDRVVMSRISRQIRDTEAAIATAEREAAHIDAEMEPLIRAERQREAARTIVGLWPAITEMVERLRDVEKVNRQLKDVADLLSTLPGCPTHWPEFDTFGGGPLAAWRKLVDTFDIDACRKLAAQ